MCEKCMLIMERLVFMPGQHLPALKPQSQALFLDICIFPRLSRQQNILLQHPLLMHCYSSCWKGCAVHFSEGHPKHPVNHYRLLILFQEIWGGEQGEIFHLTLSLQTSIVMMSYCLSESQSPSYTTLKNSSWGKAAHSSLSTMLCFMLPRPSWTCDFLSHKKFQCNHLVLSATGTSFPNVHLPHRGKM